MEVIRFANTAADVRTLGAGCLGTAVITVPHCWLLTGLDSSQIAIGAAGNATFSVTVPNNAALNGLLLFQQAAVLVPGANALGAVVTNGMRLTVGN